jgi:hypothetical protein
VVGVTTKECHVGACRALDVLDSSGCERDEEEDVDPLHEDGLDREEVAGDHAPSLRSQEGSPRRARSLWRRLETCLEQHLAHGSSGNRDAETFDFAADPFVSPVWVLAGETKDQFAERARERRSPERPMRVGPTARNQLAAPPKRVSGLTGKPAQALRGSERLIAANSARSARVSYGRAACRRRIANSWRRTRISNSFERRGRPSSHTNANRFRTTRYTSDQSKQPPSTTTRAPNLTSPDNTRKPRTSLRTLRDPVAVLGCSAQMHRPSDGHASLLPQL